VERVSEVVGELVSKITVGSLCEKVVAEVGDSSGTQRKGNVRHWKPCYLSSNG
jgi:hypothetical protein